MLSTEGEVASVEAALELSFRLLLSETILTCELAFGLLIVAKSYGLLILTWPCNLIFVGCHLVHLLLGVLLLEKLRLGLLWLDTNASADTRA